MSVDLVSVVIPVYNVEPFLERCISSVAKQTYHNLQIVLVDDGSPDACPKICDDWARRDERIEVIHQANKGLSAARNAGIRTSVGEWILLLDSDDYIACNAVEQMLNAANCVQADMTICSFAKGEEDNYRFKAKSPQIIEVIDAKTALSRLYANETNALQYAAAWCKLCRRTIYNGIDYPEGKIFEDIYTTHKLLYKCEKIAVVEAPLFYYFQRPESIMNAAFSLKKLDYLQALVERVDFFAQHDLPDLEQIAYDELLHALIWEYSRTRDILHSKEGMAYVRALFRRGYRKGYASSRYPKENARFLAAFHRNPEWIITYWRCSSLLHRVFKRNG